MPHYIPNSKPVPNTGPSKATVIVIILGLLLLLGMCSTATTTKTPSWCDTHRNDTYRGAVDNDKVQRYIEECK